MKFHQNCTLFSAFNSLKEETFMSKMTMGGKSAFKIQRRLGIEIPGLGKAGALERKPYGPGMHGMKRKKLTDYTIYGSQAFIAPCTHHLGQIHLLQSRGLP